MFGLVANRILTCYGSEQEGGKFLPHHANWFILPVKYFGCGGWIRTTDLLAYETGELTTALLRIDLGRFDYFTWMHKKSFNIAASFFST